MLNFVVDLQGSESYPPPELSSYVMVLDLDDLQLCCSNVGLTFSLSSPHMKHGLDLCYDTMGKMFGGPMNVAVGELTGSPCL